MQGGVSQEEEPTTLCPAFAQQVLSGLCVLHAMGPLWVPYFLAKGPGSGEGRALGVGLPGPLLVADWVLGGARQRPYSEVQ